MAESTNENFRFILIGSSTGGLPVIEKILSGIRSDKFAVLIAQHMPEGYTEAWAERLNSITSFTVKEGGDGEPVRCGYVYVAPGNRHMCLSDDETHPHIVINSEPRVNRFRPSIDVLFASALNYTSKRIIAIMLTGMCADGVESMIEMRSRGFLTIAQNEESSAVFGMNKEAIKRGGAGLIFAPDDIIEYLNGI